MHVFINIVSIFHRSRKKKRKNPNVRANPSTERIYTLHLQCTRAHSSHITTQKSAHQHCIHRKARKFGRSSHYCHRIYPLHMLYQPCLITIFLLPLIHTLLRYEYKQSKKQINGPRNRTILFCNQFLNHDFPVENTKFELLLSHGEYVHTIQIHSDCWFIELPARFVDQQCILCWSRSSRHSRHPPYVSGNLTQHLYSQECLETHTHLGGAFIFPECPLPSSTYIST